MTEHRTANANEWQAERDALLNEEKQLTRRADELAEKRRELPWVQIEKEYVLQTEHGPKSLAELFDGRSQLMIYHFMFGPPYETGCPVCSSIADTLDPQVAHLKARDTTLMLVSRAPLEKLEKFRRRMGWPVKWVSSQGSDFNFDFHVSFTEAELAKGEAVYNYANAKIGIDEMPGISIFYKDDAGDVFHTYSAFARGTEIFAGIFGLLDVMPKGRNETINGNLTDWVRHHDRYDAAPAACCHQEKP